MKASSDCASSCSERIKVWMWETSDSVSASKHWPVLITERLWSFLLHACGGWKVFHLPLCASARARRNCDGRAEDDDDESVTSPLSAQLLERGGETLREPGEDKQKHAEGDTKRSRAPGGGQRGDTVGASVVDTFRWLTSAPECSALPDRFHGTRRKSPRGVSTDTEAQMLALSADMDESSSLLDLLECSVCLERLDTTAKVLPCQHTFCRRCLENIVSSRNELRCPECRILVDCGVDDLPANILLVRLLDGIKQRPQRGSGGGRQSLAVGSLQGYAAGISASPPGTAVRELPVATRSSPVKVGHFLFTSSPCCSYISITKFSWRKFWGLLKKKKSCLADGCKFKTLCHSRLLDEGTVNKSVHGKHVQIHITCCGSCTILHIKKNVDVQYFCA